MKRIILILTIMAMTLAFAGSAMAEAPGYDELVDGMGFYEDTEAPGCWVAFEALYVCAPTDGTSPTTASPTLPE